MFDVRVQFLEKKLFTKLEFSGTVVQETTSTHKGSGCGLSDKGRSVEAMYDQRLEALTLRKACA